MSRVVLFVCPHGAAKSRLAAAFFARVAPPGWTATSAGLDPGPELSPTAGRLLAGTDAEVFLDRMPPRSLADVVAPDLIVGIDCGPDGATDHWELRHREFDAVMRDEIRTRSELLASDLGGRTDPNGSI
jgi:protein-tyrosine-phosphatase